MTWHEARQGVQKGLRQRQAQYPEGQVQKRKVAACPGGLHRGRRSNCGPFISNNSSHATSHIHTHLPPPISIHPSLTTQPTPFTSHHPSHSFHIIHVAPPVSHTILNTNLTPFISRPSSHAVHISHHTYFSHRSSLTIPFTPFISHYASHTIHLTLRISHPSPHTTPLTTQLIPLISHHSSHATHISLLISYHWKTQNFTFGVIRPFYSRVRSEGSRFTWGCGGGAAFAKSWILTHQPRATLLDVRLHLPYEADATSRMGWGGAVY